MFSPTCARVNGAKLMLTCGIVGVTTTQGTVMFSPTGTRVNDANWCLPVVLLRSPSYKVPLYFILLLQE